MGKCSRDEQSTRAAQAAQRDPEELSSRLNVLSATYGAAAVDIPRCKPPADADWEHKDPSGAKAADSCKRAASDDGTAKEPGATEAAATLERLRAQNRRHQANHRARVKRKIEETEYSISNIQLRLSTAKERRNELRNFQDHLKASAQQPPNIKPLLPGATHETLSNSPIGLSTLLSTSAPLGDAINPASLESRLPAQVTAFTSSFPEELATLASLGSGALPQPPAQRPHTSSSGDTTHAAHASQTPSNLSSNPFTRPGLSGSGGSGGNLTGSLLPGTLRHPATSGAVQATSSSIQNALTHPRVTGMPAPEPQHRGGLGAGAGAVASPFPTFSTALVAPHSHPAPISAPPSSLLAGASMHAMESNPLHASSASTGRTRSLWGPMHASAGVNPLQQLAEPAGAHGSQSPISAPVATDATSVGPFTQEEVSEVLSHFRRASEPGSQVPASGAAAASLNRSSAYAAVPTSSLLHGNNLLLGTGVSAPLHLGGLLSEAGGIPTLGGGGGLDLASLAGAQAKQQGIHLPEPIQLQQSQALSAPPLAQLQADQDQTPEQMLQALQQAQPPSGLQGGQQYGNPGVYEAGQWKRKHDRAFYDS